MKSCVVCMNNPIDDRSRDSLCGPCEKSLSKAMVARETVEDSLIIGWAARRARTAERNREKRMQRHNELRRRRLVG